MCFTASRAFRRDYARLFQKDPAAANVFLLLAELADEVEIQRLMAARFEDPRAYQLSGGPKR